jgi:gas vesicle structural protein
MDEAGPLDLHGDTSLAELVNRVLDRGAVISGEVVIGVAGIDLIYLGLQVAVSSVEGMERRAAADRAAGAGAVEPGARARALGPPEQPPRAAAPPADEAGAPHADNRGG